MRMLQEKRLTMLLIFWKSNNKYYSPQSFHHHPEFISQDGANNETWSHRRLLHFVNKPSTSTHEQRIKCSNKKPGKKLSWSKTPGKSSSSFLWWRSESTSVYTRRKNTRVTATMINIYYATRALLYLYVNKFASFFRKTFSMYNSY